MARPELGLKRVCQGCGAKFYDLHKNPIVCPKCGTVYEQMVIASGARARAAQPVEEDAEIEAPEAELVSLEEADAEATTGAKAPIDIDADIEIEDDGAEDDVAFLEEEEDDSDDVTDLIGDGLEDDEEG